MSQTDNLDITIKYFFEVVLVYVFQCPPRCPFLVSVSGVKPGQVYLNYRSK